MKRIAAMGCVLGAVAMVMSGGRYGVRLALATEAGPQLPSKLLLKKVVEVPSKIAVVVRLATYPRGYTTPLHTHKGPGSRYILQGTLKVVEGEKAETYTAGQVFWERPVCR